MKIDFQSISLILVSLISLAGTIYQTISNNSLSRKNKILDIELENKKIELEHVNIKFDVVTNLLRFSQYQKIYDSVIDLMEMSSVDRALIFIAVNGKTELSNVSCIFQKYKNDDSKIDAVNLYKKLRVDKHYTNLLYKLETERKILIETSNLENDSLIKDIYNNEGVKWSLWNFIGRISIDEKNDLISYCSFSKFSDEKFNNSDLLAIKLKFDSIIKDSVIETVNNIPK